MVNLYAGMFTEDPYGLPVTAGGGVDVSYLGDGCTGFASSVPDRRFYFAQAEPPLAPSSLLRFYFVADGKADSTLIIARDESDPGVPFGVIHRWFCVDDSFGTANPTYDFHDPTTDYFHVWVGAARAGDKIDGTLYVTENPANHP